MSPRPSIALIRLPEDASCPRLHMVRLLQRRWAAAGFDVREVNGASRFVPAEIAFLHVDLSIVPDSYLELARRYPRVINGKVRDISKRSYSRNLVRPADDYQGPVIVKTSLNHAGLPESFHLHMTRHRRLPQRIYRRLFGRNRPDYPYPIRDKGDYRLYPSLKDVPREVLECPGLVVEKFLPERDGESYCLREWYFLGDHEWNRFEYSDDPIFTSGISVPARACPPPPFIREVRERLGLDYGKIDYAICEGQPVLFDVNKTTGMTDSFCPSSLEIADALAEGIYAYFPELRPAERGPILSSVSAGP